MNPSFAIEAYIFLAILVGCGLCFTIFSLIWHSYPKERHRFVPTKIRHLASLKTSMEIYRGNFRLSTGEFESESGQLNLVIGASGAGKSTFCAILAGNPLPGSVFDGTISVNGESVTRFSELRNLVQYVPQHDSNFQEYYSHMMVSEVLRCQYLAHRPWSPIKCDFQRFFKGFTLDERVLSQPLSSLSGGEELQVRIISTLLVGRPIMVCDEITSGLDTHTAVKLIKLLRNIANNVGITIILTLHQAGAQIFQLCDKITVLSKATNLSVMQSTHISNIYEFRGTLHKSDARLIPDGILGNLSNESNADIWKRAVDSTTVTWGKSLWTSGKVSNDMNNWPFLYSMFVVLFRIVKRQRRNSFRIVFFTLPCFLILGGSSLLN